MYIITHFNYYTYMKIEHIAIWADNIEMLRDFYISYFNFKSGDFYHNPNKNFTSCFLYHDKDSAKIELMHKPDIPSPASRGNLMGLAHLSISVGNKKNVNSLTERLRMDGYKILSEPRTTGDGFYESAIADPEGNYVEITE